MTLCVCVIHFVCFAQLAGRVEVFKGAKLPKIANKLSMVHSSYMYSSDK
jgi:hypothetical protein